MRISEAANLHDMNKWAFNERMKVLIAGSPDYCLINPKYGKKFSVRMYCGVIITTNHLTSGIYIPEDDRRYDVIEAANLQEMGLATPEARKAYFSELWDWFLEGGDAHVAAFLTERNLSNFSAANGQRKTDAHKTVVAGGMEGDHWLIDVLEACEWPAAIVAGKIITMAVANGEKEMDVRRKLGHSIGRVGYTIRHNPDHKQGRWKVEGKSCIIYVKAGTDRSLDPRNLISGAGF